MAEKRFLIPGVGGPIHYDDSDAVLPIDGIVNPSVISDAATSGDASSPNDCAPGSPGADADPITKQQVALHTEGSMRAEAVPSDGSDVLRLDDGAGGALSSITLTNGVHTYTLSLQADGTFEIEHDGNIRRSQPVPS